MQRDNVIVSCTTTKNRLPLLYYMIKSIKKQSLKPDVLYVNLSPIKDLLNNIQDNVPDLFEQDFIQINWTEDVGSYRKLIPIIEKAGTEDLIITADDDILYGLHWLERLVNLAEEYPNNIVCARARNIKKNFFGNWQNYSRWDIVSTPKEGMYILPTGCGGVVYRKHLLDLDFLFDPAFKRLAPSTDDLWFRMATLRKNVPVLVCPEIDRGSIYLKHSEGLDQVNFNKKTLSFFQKVKKNSVGLFKDWIGLNATQNDHSWSQIVDYSKANSTVKI